MFGFKHSNKSVISKMYYRSTLITKIVRLDFYPSYINEMTQI